MTLFLKYTFCFFFKKVKKKRLIASYLFVKMLTHLPEWYGYHFKERQSHLLFPVQLYCFSCRSFYLATTSGHNWIHNACQRAMFFFCVCVRAIGPAVNCQWKSEHAWCLLSGVLIHMEHRIAKSVLFSIINLTCILLVVSKWFHYRELPEFI